MKIEQKTSYGKNYSSADPLKTRVSLHTDFSTNPVGWHQWMASELNLAEGMRVLELGCGTGDLWSHIDKNMLKTVQVYLTDSSDAMLDTCRQKFQQIDNIEYNELDLDSKFTIPKNIDLVVANHVMYHSTSPESTLSHLKQQIDPYTRCVFATNGRDSMNELSAFLPDRLAGGPMKHLIDNFTLESGLPVVERIFGEAYVTHYEDSLRVTQVEPLMDYIRSLPWRMTSEELDIARHKMVRKIETDRHIPISKRTCYISNID